MVKRDHATLTAAERAFADALVLYKDAQVIALDKPPGVAVQGGSGIERSLEDLLVAFAKSNGKHPRLVHRLDRDTSGVVVVARTKPAAAFLSKAFSDRSARKTYLAIVCGGAPKPAEGKIACALKKTSQRGLDIMEVASDDDSSAQSALTLYRTVISRPDAALVELTPETGRMHQLRVHLASIGRPIAGDGKYGGLFAIAGVPVPRLMLHASALDLPHPTGGRRRYEAALPSDFITVLEALRLRPHGD